MADGWLDRLQAWLGDRGGGLCPCSRAGIGHDLAATPEASAAGERLASFRLTSPPLGPARLVPDVTPAPSPVVVEVLADGSRRVLVSGMRLLDAPDGSLERARELLPGGNARVLWLPSRLGKGLLVYVVNGGTTQLWRAPGWLDKLEPVAEVWGSVVEIVAGFDRLYARLATGEIKALDLDSGRQLPLGMLPPATRISLLAFADAWRAVVVTDMRGPLATFDAGNSWHPIAIEGGNVLRLAVRGTDFSLETASDRFWLGPGGDLDGSAGSVTFAFVHAAHAAAPSHAPKRPAPARPPALSRAALFEQPSKTGGR